MDKKQRKLATIVAIEALEMAEKKPETIPTVLTKLYSNLKTLCS